MSHSSPMSPARREALLAERGVGVLRYAEVSSRRFADGAPFRFEIPSVEGPEALSAVIEEARRHDVVVRRVSQGSGVMMLSDGEIAAMASLAEEHGIEVSLFLGPRAGWDIGAQAYVDKAAAAVSRGARGVSWAVVEAQRACRLGIRSLLVADVGVLSVLARLRTDRVLPADLRFKTSVALPCANPAAARVLDQLGADTLNLTTDLSVVEVSEIRAATSCPLDLYVEAPDDLGGFVRHYDVPDLIRAGAPMYVKLGLRNAVSVYPSGIHLQDHAIAQVREKVRRAALVSRLIIELEPDLALEASAVSGDRSDLAVPCVVSRS
jgi:hypothetical protein